MPKVIVEKRQRYALSLSQTKFTVNSIYEYLRSVNVRVVVNGVSVMSDSGLAPTPLYELAHAIYLRAFSERFDQSEIVKIIVESIQDERKFEKQSLWQRFVEFAFCYPTLRHKGKIQTVEDTASSSWLAKLYIWLGYPKLFDIKIKDAVKFKEYSHVAKEMLIEYVDPDYIQNYLNIEYKNTVISIETPSADVVSTVINNMVSGVDQAQSKDGVGELQGGGSFYTIRNCLVRGVVECSG